MYEMEENFNYRKAISFLRKAILGLFILFSVASCKDDDDEAWNKQNHDDNEFMKLMHAMMDTMHSKKMTNDPDNDFAMMMKEHHKGAINMANLELEKGKDSTLHQLARKMNMEQQKEIAQMDSFLKAHPPVTVDSMFHHNSSMAMEMMSRNADLQFINGNADHDFAMLMIQHHHGAIDMADLEIHHGKSTKLKSIAEKIKKDQKEEIKKLQEWLLKDD